MTARTIVTGKRISVPASGRHFVDVLEKNAPHNDRQGLRARNTSPATPNWMSPATSIATCAAGRREGEVVTWRHSPLFPEERDACFLRRPARLTVQTKARRNSGSTGLREMALREGRDYSGRARRRSRTYPTPASPRASRSTKA